MQQGAVSTIDVASKGVGLYLNGIGVVTQRCMQYCPMYQKMDFYFNGRNEVQVSLVFLLVGTEVCTLYRC